METIRISSQHTVYHLGPPLAHGPLPSLFYFAISGPDTLTLDPFNQPVQFLKGKLARIFSLTLPGHEDGLPAKEAMKVWAEDLEKGRNTLEEFFSIAQTAVDVVIREKLADPNQLAASGLSRGGFIAAHLTAREERIRRLICWAPLTRLSRIKEFSHLKDLETIHQYDLTHLAEALTERHIQLFIGNADTRVGTQECFDFAMSIVKKKKMRPPDLSLKIYPSIGQMGHGTPPEIFKQGVDWLNYD